MPASFAIRQSFAVPVTSGQYAPEVITLAHSTAALTPISLLGVTALIEALVASATVELWLLKIGGNSATSTDYFYAGKSTTTGDTWPLASWPGAQLRVKSGGTAGTCIVNATADE